MKHPFGRRVRIKDIADKSDLDLNGQMGTLQKKFFTRDNPYRVFGEVGVWLDEPLNGARCVNIKRTEYELVYPSG